MTRRLVLGYLAITIIVLAVLEIPLAVFYGQREEERLTAEAERDAVVLASFYEDVLEQGTVPDTEPVDAYAARTGARIIVVDSAGISVVDSDAEPDLDFSTRPEVDTALSGVRSAGIRRSDTLDTDILYVAVPVASSGVVHGVVRLTIDAHEVVERVRRFWIGLGAVAVVVLVSVAVIGLAVARSVTRPLRELQESARRFADGKLTPSPIGDAPAEVRALDDAMNTMARRLDHLIQSQRSFVSDASHQLRTPLTALRLRLENLETQLGAEQDREEVGAAIDEIERLSELVNSLLRLARADEIPPTTAVDVATLAADRVDTWSAVADVGQISIRFVSPPPPRYAAAVAGAIEQVLDNVLDNALNASPPDSTITVRVEPREAMTRVVVSDQGPGLNDESKSKALERFWRGDTSTPGSGLGLAIAQRLAEAGGGSLGLEDNADGGLAVVLSLPTVEGPVDSNSPGPAGEPERGEVSV